MSVIVNCMKMPNNCKECPFLYDGNACYAMNKLNSMFLPLVCNGSTNEYPINKFPFEEKRVDWCPLVELIRCKDCKYSKPIDSEWLECQHDKRVMKHDGFCSWAEPKDSTAEVRRQLKETEQRKEMERKK